MADYRFCDFCGQPFEPQKWNQRFCCPQHKDAWWRDSYKVHAHNCPLCGARHDPLWRRGAKAPRLERDAYGEGEAAGAAGGAGGGP